MLVNIKNTRDEEYGIGDIAYYILLELNGYFAIRKLQIKSFTIYGDNKIVVNAKHGKVNINDLHKTREECKEMIEKWQNENIRSILVKEIKSSIAKNKKKDMAMIKNREKIKNK